MGMPPGTTYGSGTWAAHNTIGASVYPAPALTASDIAALDVTKQVPSRKTTTWSLAGF